jgi:hypothetical protein
METMLSFAFKMRVRVLRPSVGEASHRNLKGVLFSNVANNASDMVNDISGAAGALANFNGGAVIDTAWTLPFFTLRPSGFMRVGEQASRSEEPG